MLLQRISYFLREAFRNLRTNPLVSSISTAIIALSILIFGLFLVIFVNFTGLFQRWGRRVAVDVYIAQGVKEEGIKQLGVTLEAMPEVSKIFFVSEDEAYRQFQEMLGPQAELLDELGENPLPASFRLTPQEKAHTPPKLKELAGRIKLLPGVEEVRYGAQWVARFHGLIQVLRMMGLVIGGILLLASVLIISNTIRLSVYSRKEEIEIMRLVGATETFIRVPFFLEGLFQGFVAGVLAVSLLWVGYKLLLVNIHIPVGGLGFGQILFLPTWAAAALVGGGTLLGVLGSSVALGRFMD